MSTKSVHNDSKMSASKPRGAPKRSLSSAPTINLDERMDVVLANNWNASGECTMLIQIDPDDAADLELEGSQGVVGRIETDDEGVILDLKGKQYRGRIFPGPTAMVLSVSSKTDVPQLKVEAVTDEFVRLQTIGKSMDKFQAKTVGDMDEYLVDNDEDVNRNRKVKSKSSVGELEQSSGQELANHQPASKRKATSANKGSLAKKRKPSAKK
ncbi:hypothetical protein MPSEU_000603900 [Mayamaea pseudoterrestris]|nr:hypothetical protein MPSEU_000603900 [Mayamaea pseudoterrestris]